MLHTANKLINWIYARGQRFHALRHIEIGEILRLLQPKRDERILDIGCGKGFLCAGLHKSGVIVTGIDPSENELAIARQFNSKSIRFDVGTGEILPYKNNEFDKAVSVCVLEHTNNPDGVIHEANRILKPGGVLVMSVDSLNSPWISKRFIEQHKIKYHANFIFTKNMIMEMLAKNGFHFDKGRYLFSGRLTQFILFFGWLINFGFLFKLSFYVMKPLLKLDFIMNSKIEHGLIYVFKAVKRTAN